MPGNANSILIVILVVSLVSACVNVNNKKGEPEEIAQAHVALGGEYYRQRRLDLALESLKKALDADPQSVEANSMIALVYEDLDEPKLAQEYFERAIEYVSTDSPLYGGVHNNYGSYLCGKGSRLSAEEHFLKAVNNKLYKTPEIAFENAGICALESERKQEASEYFQQALKIQPNMLRSLFEMAKLQYEKSDYLSARNFIQRFHSLSAPTAASLLLSFRNEDKLGSKEEAIKVFEQLQTSFPKSQEFNVAKKIVVSYDQ